MGKRSDFKRHERDYYKTPIEAVEPLVRVLSRCRYVEPCAGDATLIMHLNHYGFICDEACDIEPQVDQYKSRLGYKDMYQADAMTKKWSAPNCFITNPPWDRKLLHRIIDNLSAQAPTWLLFDADWMHTKQSSELMKHCRMIISVGRVKWIPASKMTGKDNCAWYMFSQTPDPFNLYGRTKFIGR